MIATSTNHPASDRIRTVTSGSFDLLVLQGTGPIVVEFMSYGCAHCRVIEPVLQKVTAMLESKVKIFRLNVAVDQELANSYEIQSTPTLVMFRNGIEVGRADGPRPTVSSVLSAVTQSFES